MDHACRCPESDNAIDTFGDTRRLLSVLITTQLQAVVCNDFCNDSHPYPVAPNRRLLSRFGVTLETTVLPPPGGPCDPGRPRSQPTAIPLDTRRVVR